MGRGLWTHAAPVLPFFADVETGELWASADESRTDALAASAGHAIRSSHWHGAHGHGAHGHGAHGHGAAEISGINEILSFLHRWGLVEVNIPVGPRQSAFRPFWMFRRLLPRRAVSNGPDVFIADGVSPQ